MKLESDANEDRDQEVVLRPQQQSDYPVITVKPEEEEKEDADDDLQQSQVFQPIEQIIEGEEQESVNDSVSEDSDQPQLGDEADA